MAEPHPENADGMHDIAPAEWNALAGATQPFTRHEYLHALEQSQSANRATGWQPAHLLARENGIPVGALPLYRKFHSFGEFVFDFAWADACARAGIAYYPKLLTAIPFTPVAGARLLGEKALPLIETGLDIMHTEDISSWHVLFPDPDEHDAWRSNGFLPRMSTRFVWTDNDYGDFEGFLAALKQKRRKEIRRERRQVTDAAIHFRVLQGNDIDTPALDAIYRCYSRTYLLRGQMPYLTRAFFSLLLENMADALVVFLGERPGEDGTETIAAAICLRDAKTLYGRWWGTLADLPGLHFEACYYQGITFCLEHGLTRYDPGVQGEHKLARGFAPEATWSMHRFNHSGLETAVRNALVQETSMLTRYMAECREHLPFRTRE